MLKKPINKKDIPYPMPIVGKPINLKPIKPGKDKPYPMPEILPPKAGEPRRKAMSAPFPGPSIPKYSPIKNTKQVNKIYNTY